MGKNLSILVVDDDTSVTTSLSRLLTIEGHRVMTASDGAEGLAKIQASAPFDVIITDSQMPRLSGIEFIRHLRANNFLGRLVALSGHLTDASRRALEQLNVDRIVEKPFDAATFPEAIAALAL